MDNFRKVFLPALEAVVKKDHKRRSEDLRPNSPFELVRPDLDREWSERQSDVEYSSDSLHEKTEATDKIDHVHVISDTRGRAESEFIEIQSPRSCRVQGLQTKDENLEVCNAQRTSDTEEHGDSSNLTSETLNISYPDCENGMLIDNGTTTTSFNGHFPLDEPENAVTLESGEDDDYKRTASLASDVSLIGLESDMPHAPENQTEEEHSSLEHSESDEELAGRDEPLSKNQFLSFFDSDGRLIHEHVMRTTIFKGK